MSVVLPMSLSAIDWLDATGRVSAADASWVCQKADAALGVLLGAGVGPSSVAVRVVGDGEMAAAHQKHLGLDSTTDVLTFDLGSSVTEPRCVQADIIVCLDEATRQATARGHGVREELLLYIIHGMLHCLGHDDHDDDAFARMHAEEDRVLSAIGV
ncbi:MAG: rRNA maturation RNase YbeY, partial [Phycisphaerales bacterium]|nr:rRNA maturation RNase YbeY [Phycisphaerales bacterium]